MNKNKTRRKDEKTNIKNKLRIFNFRLSIEDIKRINRLGIGKNSSDKLRYILRKYQCDKINSKTRRTAYKIEKSFDIELLNKKFKQFIDDWEKSNKTEFLINSSLHNIIHNRKVHKIRAYIEHNEYFNMLKNFDWNIQNIDFYFENEDKFIVIFQKKNQNIKMYLSKSDDELIENTILQSDKEEELFSFLFNDLQSNIISPKFESETENFLNKKYINGDSHKMLDYGNITVAELEYFNETKLVVLTTIKTS